jgi:hypothetical protein
MLTPQVEISKERTVYIVMLGTLYAIVCGALIGAKPHCICPSGSRQSVGANEALCVHCRERDHQLQRLSDYTGVRLAGRITPVLIIRQKRIQVRS